jgi:serralysin
MKTASTLLLAACLSLTSCAGTGFKVDFTGSVGNKPAEPEQKSCVAIDADLLDEQGPMDGILKIWGQRSKFWAKDQVIRVRFLDGSVRQRTETAKRFDKLDQLCGITMQYVDSGPSEWRVSFRGNGHWSYLGTDCLRIPPNSPTMNISLGQYMLNDPAKEWDRVVIHEALHGLGFDHEQAHPSANIPWNKPVVYRAYAVEQGWSRSQVDQQVFNRYRGNEFLGTAYDSKSIMHYPIPRAHVTNGKGVGWNDALTETDKAGILARYPLPATTLAP